jgi:hypothetical protein
VILHNGGSYFEGPHGLERLLEPTRALTPFDILDIDRQLADGEQRHTKREAARIPERPASDPNAPPDAIEQANEQLFEETRKLAEFRASDSGQRERQIELLERVVQLLEERRS